MNWLEKVNRINEKIKVIEQEINVITSSMLTLSMEIQQDSSRIEEWFELNEEIWSLRFEIDEKYNEIEQIINNNLENLEGQEKEDAKEMRRVIRHDQPTFMTFKIPRKSKDTVPERFIEELS